MAQYEVQRKAIEQKNSSNSSARTVQLKHNNVASIIQMAKMNPEMLSQNDVMVLQKTMGNGAVSQLIKGAGDKHNETIQKKDGKLEGNESLMQKENNTGLPDNLKAGVENLSGIDMSDVRVHYNSDKPAGVGALAYTQGTDIHVAPGQERHLPHEAWHVVQQAQGRVKPTMQLANAAVNDDKGLEAEADVMGPKAFFNQQAMHQSTMQYKTTGKEINRLDFKSKIVQRVLEPGDPAPTVEAMLEKRFFGIINKSEVAPRGDALLASVNQSLNNYTQNVPNILVTEEDCAKFGIFKAIESGSLNDISALNDFADIAQLLTMGQIQRLGLNEANVNTIIQNQVKLALHDALKNTVNKNINTKMGISDLIAEIERSIQILRVPPQTAEEIFIVALSREWHAHPFSTFNTYQQFKATVQGETVAEIGEEYFNELPGSQEEKTNIVENSHELANERFIAWETNYLKRTHVGLADVQTELINVNRPDTIHLNDLEQSYTNIINESSHEYLAHHPQNADFNELQGHNKLFLSILLKNMPVVKAILNVNGQNLDNEHQNPAWHDQAVLVNRDNDMSVKEVKDVQSPAHRMQVNIRSAMRKINNLVDRKVLEHSGTPNFVIHKDLSLLKVLMQKKFDNIMGFRAFADDDGNQVNVGLDEKIEVLMHEMGHLIEDNLGTKEWLDIQSLLHMRHDNAPGGNQLSHVYDTGLAKGVALILPQQAREEPAYRGIMPATGRYSSKFYEGGSTEVMSMTIEHFGSPEKALNLIEQDPLQAAIILRALQPTQFQEYVLALQPEVTNWLP